MRQEEVLSEEVLCEIVKGDILGTEAVGSGDAADAGKFVHILLEKNVNPPALVRFGGSLPKFARRWERVGSGREDGDCCYACTYHEGPTPCKQRAILAIDEHHPRHHSDIMLPFMT